MGGSESASNISSSSENGESKEILIPSSSGNTESIESPIRPESYIRKPLVVALGIYLFLMIISCLWLLGSFFMALPPEEDSINETQSSPPASSPTQSPRPTPSTTRTPTLASPRSLTRLSADNNDISRGGQKYINERNHTSLFRDSYLEDAILELNASVAKSFRIVFMSRELLRWAIAVPMNRFQANFIRQHNQRSTIASQSETLALPSTQSATPTQPATPNEPTPMNEQGSTKKSGIKMEGVQKRITIRLSFLGRGTIPVTVSGEAYLFFIVLLSGALGAGVRAIFSFFRHIGLGDFSVRWAWYYVLLHFGGAALSVILYFVIRGEFYNPTTVNGDLPLNPFSFAALGALSGLFSENAMLKLKMVAEVLLTKVEEKNDRAVNARN